MLKPETLSLRLLKQFGYRSGKVSYFIQNRSFDLFGCWEILGITGEINATLAVQATSRTNVNSRLKKLLGDRRDATLDSIYSFGTCQVHGWDECADGVRCEIVELQLEEKKIKLYRWNYLFQEAKQLSLSPARTKYQEHIIRDQLPYIPGHLEESAYSHCLSVDPSSSGID